MDYSAGALGEVIRDLRQARDPRMSQEELGRSAGYRTGAGVSMSRIENGLTRPGPRRLAGIAAALGVTVRELEVRSVGRTPAPAAADLAAADPAGGRSAPESTTQRMRRVQDVFARRESRAVQLGGAFNAAHDAARDDFLLALVVAARDVTDRPSSATGRPPGSAGPGHAAADADLRHRVAVAGLTSALASGAAAQVVESVADPEAAYTALVTTAVIAPTVVDRPEAAPHAATRATRALLGGGGSVTGRTGLAAAAVLLSGFVASAGSPLIAAGALAWVARRSRQQNDQLRLELDRAESNLTASRPRFDAVMDVLSGATELLTYVAVHAGHASARWRDTLPGGPVGWTDLTDDQRRAYLTFVDVAAHQVCVDSINVTELLAAPPGEQDVLVESAHAVLAAAGREIHRLV